VAVAVAAVMAACNSSSPAATPCNENPWQCAAGQTCWPQPCNCAAGWQFACIASAQGIPLGESCMLQLGTATCGDMQTCVAFQDAGTGTCRAYCDPANPARGCGPEQVCIVLAVGNASPARVENVCVPAPTYEDASFGVDGGGGSSSGGLSDVFEQPADVFADNANTHQ
jgi:hypothetical protein